MKSDQRRMLRARAHALKPVVIVGQAGITPGVMSEINLALDHHELIKVRINAADREQRREMVSRICRDTGAELIQSMGHIVTLFRENPDA